MMEKRVAEKSKFKKAVRETSIPKKDTPKKGVGVTGTVPPLNLKIM